jgi:hypothetical protein
LKIAKNSIWFLISGLGGFVALWFLEGYWADLFSTGENDFPINLIPGFRIKMDSLGPSGIQSIIGQLKFRWLILIGFSWFLQNGFFKNSHLSFSSSQALWVVRILTVVQLLYLPDLARELQIRSQWADLYEPLPIWKWVLPSYLPGFFHQWAILLLFGTGAFAILKKWPFESGFWILIVGFTLLVWTILLAQFFGFGKIDHTYSSLYSGLWGLFIWLIFNRMNWLSANQGFRLFQAFIWCCYFFSGCEKVLFSGFEWLSSSHFSLLSQLHPTQPGNWVMGQPFLASALLFFALCFQLLTPIQWFFPKWGYINAIGAILFHLGTWYLLGIGGWQSPWILTAIFLLPVWQTGLNFSKNENL